MGKASFEACGYQLSPTSDRCDSNGTAWDGAGGDWGAHSWWGSTRVTIRMGYAKGTKLHRIDHVPNELPTCEAVLNQAGREPLAESVITVRLGSSDTTQNVWLQPPDGLLREFTPSAQFEGILPHLSYKTGPTAFPRQEQLTAGRLGFVPNGSSQKDLRPRSGSGPHRYRRLALSVVPILMDLT